MTDQTAPITDDDRQAHEWADHQLSLDVNDEVIVTAARAIKAHVPAPPKSLADEIRGADWNGLGDKIMAERFADRVAAVERELAGHKRDYAECQQELIASKRKCFSARAEVERLTSERTSKESLPVATLPDPADVPEGEAWAVVGPHGPAIGYRVSYECPQPWSIVTPFETGDDVSDTDITLVARLVPDTRRVIGTVEGLDALPAGSVVLDKDGDAWQRWDDGMWSGAVGISRSTEMLIGHYGPVAALYVPEVTA